MLYLVLPSLLLAFESFSRLIISVGGEKARFSAIDYSSFCCFCSKEFSLPLDAWERLRYFILALLKPSI